MSFWSAMVVIVAIIAFTAMRIVRYAAGVGHAGRHHRWNKPVPEAPSPRELELQREVEDLRDRIAVLERIATDSNSSSRRRTRAIADEIESLRDS